MSEVWFTSDLHLGHPKMAELRGFSSSLEHDEAIMYNLNSMVKKRDSLYILGDVVFSKHCLHYLADLSGLTTIVLGNHDQRRGREYLKYVYRVEGAATKTYSDMRTIMTHVPVHPCQFDHRFVLNIHGHLHSKQVIHDDHWSCLLDMRYLNVSPEQNNLQPFHLDAIRERLAHLKENADAGYSS